MKIAIVHDYIKEYGGAERVLEALHEIWPEAPVYTTVYLPEYLGPHRKRFEDWEIRTSLAQYLPFKAKLISPLRIAASFLFRSFDFSEYDAVIVSATGAYTPNVISNIKYQISNIQIKNEKSKKPIFITYCHTPPRYLYGYATARDWKRNIVFRILGEVANHFLRMVDFKAAQNVDYFIANSENVAQRIKKFYRRETKVIYPPVDIAKEIKILRYKDTKSGKETPNILVSQYPNIPTYYLCGGRLARPKHIDLVIQTCLELNLPLKVFGKGFGDYEKDIKRLRYKDIKSQKESPNIPISQYPNIQFLGEVSDGEKMELMRNAKAYIFASEDEDFGITPVEAMSVGTPVIAYKSGGVVESLLEGKTGLFFDTLSIESLGEAIKKLEKAKIRPEDCVSQAQKFSKERFKREIQEYVSSKL